MIKIRIPKKFAPEIQYTFEVLIGEFLGLPHFFITDDDHQNFLLELESGKVLTISNRFFELYAEPLGYQVPRALPHAPALWSDHQLGIQDLPILYGEATMSSTDDSIQLHADLIASSFFMLSRWEEVIDDQKDEHDRSTAAHSTAVKFGFLHRPIVNEYAELLWCLLQKAGYSGARTQRTFSAVVTHDIDQPYQWPNWQTNTKHIAGDLIKRRDLSMAIHNTQSLYRTTMLGAPDPYDQHQYLIDWADRHGYQAYFNMIISQRTRYDQSLPPSDPRYLAMIRRIEAHGHKIGFHPGYAVYLDADIFNQELNVLQSMVRQKIISGRQHYLRFKVPHTWRLWDQAGLEWESSMGYTQMPGFRCGTCYTYTVFDCLLRKKLKVKEKPLLLMDATLIYYLKHWDHQHLIDLKQACKKHGGEWVTIWHNDLVQHKLLKDFGSIILN